MTSSFPRPNRTGAAPLLRRRPAVALPAIVLVALSAAACPGASTDHAPLACRQDADCAADAHCRGGACVADLPPRALIAGPRAAVAHSELTFDGSGSTDDDDEVAEYAWSVRSVSAACAADLGRTTDPQLHPVFPCPGDFEITLVVRDRAGLVSLPVTARVAVDREPSTPPVVTVGADVVLAHRCAGTPLACTLVAPDGAQTFQLSAHGRDHLGSDAVTYRWEWIAPAAAAAGHPGVTFLSDERGPAPVVSIATPGTAIAGAWRFVVTVTDAEGLTTRESQSVVVQNRPPLVTGGEAIAVPHVYDAAARRYLAAGSVAYTAVDPDGDPVAPSFSFLPAGDRCVFGPGPAAADDLGRATSGFALSCADPADLVGVAPRTIALSVSDVNGAATSARWTVAVTNRPPVLTPVAATVSLPHTVDDPAAPTSFVVRVPSPFIATDPDGDPLTPVALTPLVDLVRGPHSTGRTLPDGGAGPLVAFATPVAFPLEFRQASGASPFTVRGEVSDPWAAAQPASVAVAVEDRPPALVSAPQGVVLAHRYDGRAYLASGSVGVVVDPDGDPLAIQDAGGSAPCTTLALVAGPGGLSANVTCSLPYDWTKGGAPPLRQLLGPQQASFRVRDPWSLAVASSAPVTIADHPAVASLPPWPVFVNVCQDGVAPPPVVNVPLTADVADAEADPVVLTWSTNGAGVVSLQLASSVQVCWPGHGGCGFEVPLSSDGGGTTVLLDALDGLNRSTASQTITILCEP